MQVRYSEPARLEKEVTAIHLGPIPPRPLGSLLLIYGGPPSSISQLTCPSPATRLPLAPVASSSAAVSRSANSQESEDIHRQRRLGLDAVRSTEWAAELVRRRTLIGMSSSRSDRPTGIRIRRPGRRHRRMGWRTSRVFPLDHDNLYLSPDHPQTMFTERAHHSCGICLQVKSHPVS
jgi:hypothetical protein